MTKLDWTAEVTRLDDAAEFETLEEAIAAALADLDPGGIVAIHADDCSVEADGETGCNCDVIELVKGELSN